MFDHVSVRAADRAVSQRFYLTVLGAAGIEQTYDGGMFAEWGDFSLAQADDDRPPTRNLHIGFSVASREHVEAFWEAGIAAGHPDEGRPGPRPQYTADYYGAFLRDPDGNSAEAVHHGGRRRDGCIDHLWIRVADLAAARAFYETIAPHAGLRLVAVEAARVQFRGNTGSFSLVAGEPAEHVHLAFPGPEAAVRAFHATATSAGYRDDGGPGERPHYHPGYYAAFVLDPDGNSVEVVDHRR